MTAQAAFTPGHCAVHPTQELVTHARAGLRSYSWPWRDDPRLVICLDPHHAGAQLDNYRCAWCGGRLYPDLTHGWSTSDRKVSCSGRCRLASFRARRRESRA